MPALDIAQEQEGYLTPEAMTEVANALNLDPGYVSRLIASLHARKLVTKQRALSDGRQTELTLTDKGRKAFAALDRRSSAQAGKLIAPLTPAERSDLTEALRIVRNRLGGCDRLAFVF